MTKTQTGAPERLRLTKHASGYWKGTYRAYSCMVGKFEGCFRAYLAGMLQPGKFSTIELAENFLMSRIDDQLLELELEVLEQKRADEAAARAGFSRRAAKRTRARQE